MEAQTFCEKTKFSVFCKACEDICGSTREKKIQILRSFIESYREQSKDKPDDSIYPLLRLWLPQLERERGPYGVKENMLARMYIRVLCIAKESPDGQKLLHFRMPKMAGSQAGDFADVAYWVLRSRCSSQGHRMTLFQINRHLDNIAAMHASHDPRGVDGELTAITLNTNATEQKWLIRILLKDLKLGLSSSTILDIFHQDAKELYSVSNDLRKLCVVLKEAGTRLHEIQVALFEPFQPMLSARCDAQALEKSLRKGADYYLVEQKYDGERFQLHYEKGEFKYFSRGSKDYTDTYGCNASNGILSPFLIKSFGPNIRNCILDGEMMAWNIKFKTFTTKGKSQEKGLDVKLLRVGNVHRPCFCVFDILFYNSQVLTNKPLVDRVAVLKSILTGQEGVLVVTAQEMVKKENLERDVMKHLNKAIDNLEEGIVLKIPDSIYKPNGRQAGWFKIKPEYSEGVMAELDLLVIGGYYGEGRRRGLVSHFLLAVAVIDETTGAKEFHSVCRVGSGFSDDELREVSLKLGDHWKGMRANQMPTGVFWSKEKPDLWIPPEKSVKATEVISSDAFKAGYTLRFPRIQRVREDKPWHDCMTLLEFQQLTEATSGKLCAQYAEKGHSTRGRKRKTPQKKPTLGMEFAARNLSGVKKTSNVFLGREFCLIMRNMEDNCRKEDLEAAVVRNGGKIAQNAGKGTFCVVTNDESNIRIKSAVKCNFITVVRVYWLEECLEAGKLLPWRPEHVISASENVGKSLALEYDAWGDSYTEMEDEDGLKRRLQAMPSGPHPSLTEIRLLEEELFAAT